MNSLVYTYAPAPSGRVGVGIKVCGMNSNTAEVAALQPDYLGFIFYESSKRNYTGKIPTLLKSIKKVGVFVDAPLDFVIEKVTNFKLDVIQLHGNESPEYCMEIKQQLKALPSGEGLGGDLHIWKVFPIKNTFNFETLKPYEDVVDAFLFDTKGKEKGGNGYTFNWDVLKEYPSQKPFVLSGGIGLEEISAVKEILETNLPIMAIDVNSKFEVKPGLKKIKTLQDFINSIKNS
ncbi:phosphoribosylanthranilate isomerase [Rasiella sp. SM2506]|uniref:phosphoribosylanthranilate isomerase n=1 Tax=Rasiella sp. SM2506 TaxID=3423914 RepID=UPI003D78CFBE